MIGGGEIRMQKKTGGWPGLEWTGEGGIKMIYSINSFKGDSSDQLSGAEKSEP